MHFKDWLTVWMHFNEVLRGLGTTILFFAAAAIGGFLLGCVCVYAMEGRSTLPKRLLRTALDVLRTLPFLIVLYLLYYGLPQLGIRLGSWEAGFAALITYHSAYFAEILRGARVNLPIGQVESARSHGFRPTTAYFRILLPQMVLRSGPLIGNQLIGCLKDTSFLSIITIYELTAVANALQAMYFIPLPAFVIVILAYWLISLILERLLRRMGRYAKLRGLSYE